MINTIFRKLGLRKLHKTYKNVDDIHTARIILRTIVGLLAAFLAVLGVAFFSKDTTQMGILLIGGLLLIIPLTLLYHGHLRASSLILAFFLVIIMTISAILGQGIHDIAVLTFPAVIFFANLIMQRRDFYWISFGILAALALLGFGEAFGWYTPIPFKANVMVDLVIAIVILIITFIIADMLSENIRNSMMLAKREIALRKETEEKLRDLNIHDPLTGAYNRAFFDEILLLLEKSRDYPVSIIFSDIDNLKEINDLQGHAVGDDLLIRTTQVLSSALRASDVLARVGGDEFAAVLPQADSETVFGILLRIKNMLDEYNKEHPDLPIEISLGSSTAEAGNLKNAVNLADQRMYEDKENRKAK